MSTIFIFPRGQLSQADRRRLLTQGVPFAEVDNPSHVREISQPNDEADVIRELLSALEVCSQYTDAGKRYLGSTALKKLCSKYRTKGTEAKS